MSIERALEQLLIQVLNNQSKIGLRTALMKALELNENPTLERKIIELLSLMDNKMEANSILDRLTRRTNIKRVNANSDLIRLREGRVEQGEPDFPHLIKPLEDLFLSLGEEVLSARHSVERLVLLARNKAEKDDNDELVNLVNLLAELPRETQKELLTNSSILIRS